MKKRRHWHSIHALEKHRRMYEDVAEVINNELAKLMNHH